MRIGKVTAAMAAMLDGGAGADEREPGAPATAAAAEAVPPETGGSSHRAAAALERDAGDCVLDTQARLGRGSGCTVFKGRLRSRQAVAAAAPQDAHQDVAVKVLTSRLEAESHPDDAATFLSDLRAEIRIGSMLPEHANLPRFVGFCGAETALGCRDSGVHHGQHHVLKGGRMGQQMKLLKDKPQLLIA